MNITLFRRIMHIFSAEHMNVQQIWLFNQNYVFSTIYDVDFNRFCCGIDARIVHVFGFQDVGRFFPWNRYGYVMRVIYFHNVE